MTSFWSIWVIVLTLACLAIIFGLLLWNLKTTQVLKKRKLWSQFDGIEELNNPLPNGGLTCSLQHSFGQFIIAAYPGLGNWEGLVMDKFKPRYYVFRRV